MNIDIHILINMNIDTYISYYVVCIIYSLLATSLRRLCWMATEGVAAPGAMMIWDERFGQLLTGTIISIICVAWVLAWWQTQEGTLEIRQILYNLVYSTKQLVVYVNLPELLIGVGFGTAMAFKTHL